MEDGAILGAIKQAIGWTAVGVEMTAAAIIGLAVIEAAIRTALLHLRPARPGGDPFDHHDAKEDVRLRLGKWLAVSLEFLLAADILETAVAPTWDSIGKLAAVAAIRTLLNFFLQREIDAAERRAEADAAEAAVADSRALARPTG